MQEAVSRFKQDESVRKRVLELAKSEGATPVERIVQPQSTAPADDAPAAGKPGTAAEQPSIFVTRQRTFKEIRAGAAGGLVPRLVQDELELLFWVRTADGGTAGCLVNLARLSERLVALLPDPFTGERILTVLDEAAEPLADASRRPDPRLAAAVRGARAAREPAALGGRFVPRRSRPLRLAGAPAHLAALAPRRDPRRLHRRRRRLRVPRARPRAARRAAADDLRGQRLARAEDAAHLDPHVRGDAAGRPARPIPSAGSATST